MRLCVGSEGLPAMVGPEESVESNKRWREAEKKPFQGIIAERGDKLTFHPCSYKATWRYLSSCVGKVIPITSFLLVEQVCVTPHSLQPHSLGWRRGSNFHANFLTFPLDSFQYQKKQLKTWKRETVTLFNFSVKHRENCNIDWPFSPVTLWIQWSDVYGNVI